MYAFWTKVKSSFILSPNTILLSQFLLLLDLNTKAMTSSRGFKDNLDFFCYICGELTTTNNRKPINDLVRKAHRAYFEVKLYDQDKATYCLRNMSGALTPNGLGVFELYLMLYRNKVSLSTLEFEHKSPARKHRRSHYWIKTTWSQRKCI